MLCQECHQREATVHLVHFTTTEGAESEGRPESNAKRHLCQDCADVYFASIPEMHAARGLICLSDFYRSRLYDLLEQTHPEVFDNHSTEACRRGAELMQNFLRSQLKKDHIEINDDGFSMLCIDFFGSHHFYTRLDEFTLKNR